MSRCCISPASKAIAPRLDGVGKGARHAHRIGCRRNRGIQQHGVVAHLHGLCRMRGCADARIDDERHCREIFAQGFQRIAVGEAAPGADRRAPRHQDLAARSHQALGCDQVLGGVGKDLEPVLAEDGRGLDQAEQIGLQRVVVADHLELDPVGSEQLAGHLRGGDGLLRRAAACGVGQHAHAKLLDEVEEALAAVAGSRHLAAQRDRDDGRTRGCHGLAHDLRRGIARGADQQARRHLHAIEAERFQRDLPGIMDIHGGSLSAALPRRHDLHLVALS